MHLKQEQHPEKTVIHQTAVIHPDAVIAKGVVIGPYCVVGENVKIEQGVVLHSHVVVEGHTIIGEDTEVFPFASLGTAPQDLKYSGEESRLIIGKRNKIREHVTMNPGTEGDRMETIVGDDCLFMMACHVAHDCVVGNRVIMANNATLAGHVHVGDNAIIGGLSAARQFVHIGQNAMIGGMTGVENDVIPYGLVMGERGYLAGLNLVGLERSGVAKAEIQALRRGYKKLFSEDDNVFSQRKDTVRKDAKHSDLITELIQFLDMREGKALCQPKAK